MNDLWKVHGYCGMQYDIAKEEAGKAAAAGDYTRFIACDAQAAAFRQIQDLIAVIITEGSHE